MVSLSASVFMAALATSGTVEMLEFTSASCGPCRLMQPTIQRLQAEGAPIREVDIDQEQLGRRRRGRSITLEVAKFEGSDAAGEQRIDP